MEAFEKTLFDALMDVMDEVWQTVERSACGEESAAADANHASS